MTADEMYTLLQAGLLPEKLELINGRLLGAGDTEYVFTPAQARAAQGMGITVRSAVDAVLEDPHAVDELRRRLGEDRSG